MAIAFQSSSSSKAGLGTGAGAGSEDNGGVMRTARPTGDPLIRSRFYAFPPAYSLQPNAVTRESQLRSWSALVQRYCAFRRQFRLVLADTLDSPLFHNATIGRRLNHAEVSAVLEYMVSGRIAWLSSSSSSSAAGASSTGNSNMDSSETGDFANTVAASTAMSIPPEQHDQRAEWTSAEKSAVWIYWRRPEEWADVLVDWVAATGQRGAVLTFYELVQGQASGPGQSPAQGIGSGSSGADNWDGSTLASSATDVSNDKGSDAGQAQADQQNDFYGMPEDFLKKVLAVLVKRGKAQIFGTAGTQGVKFF